MVKIHNIKCWKEFFSDIKTGKKSFELRINDRNYEVGDTLHLREYDSITGLYTGKDCFRDIAYILGGHEGIKEGYIIMAIKHCDDAKLELAKIFMMEELKYGDKEKGNKKGS